VGARFIFNSLRGHVLTTLRSLKVILNFRAHAARLMRSRSQVSSTSTISLISQSRDVTPAAIAGARPREDGAHSTVWKPMRTQGPKVRAFGRLSRYGILESSVGRLSWRPRHTPRGARYQIFSDLRP
jgi:hypothetical protein